jgi:hypothetical protein
MTFNVVEVVSSLSNEEKAELLSDKAPFSEEPYSRECDHVIFKQILTYIFERFVLWFEVIPILFANPKYLSIFPNQATCCVQNIDLGTGFWHTYPTPEIRLLRLRVARRERRE